MAGDAFLSGENMVSATKVQKMNQKTRFRGTGAEVSAMSGNDGPFAGQEVFISSTGSGFTVDKLYQRNNANSAWQEKFDVATGKAPDSSLLNGTADGVADATILKIPVGTNGQVLTRSGGNVVYQTLAVATIAPDFLSPATCMLIGGATLIEMSGITGEGGIVASMSVVTHSLKWNIRVPADATGVTATLQVQGEGTLINLNIHSRSVNAGENPISGGQTDSQNVQSTPTNNQMAEFDVSNAFNASGIIDAGNLLSIELILGLNNATKIIGIELEWS